ncbi:hypothetical protein SDC9_125488 [bioreactor metagenome]|uniref:Uncharacterized protein n=1 Tax=bioreactor metagenome TaxID=1076179 RepID=A0A645CNI5_9ZZZZ
MILVDVHSRLLAAFERDARANDLRQAVDVEGLEAELFLQLAAHLVGPGFRAEDARLERDIRLRCAAFTERLREV